MVLFHEQHRLVKVVTLSKTLEQLDLTVKLAHLYVKLIHVIFHIIMLDGTA